MFFTREPIIESIITPREGCKLVIRSSKGSSQEDYYVDAVEIVSFGHSIFYRSLEKPKSFLLPIQDYEVLELKETRMVLKNANLEGSIKIAGGKDPAPLSAETKELPKKRRSRRKRASSEKTSPKKEVSPEETIGEPVSEPAESPVEENQPYLSTLLPPPPILIKETLSRTKEEEILSANTYPEEEASFEGDESKDAGENKDAVSQDSAETESSLEVKNASLKDEENKTPEKEAASPEPLPIVSENENGFQDSTAESDT
ncbi:MAG: hypothetical protein AAGI90_05825 [Chlamydiota bacterium]